MATAPLGTGVAGSDLSYDEFKQAVLEQQIRNARASGRQYYPPVPTSELDAVEGEHDKGLWDRYYPDYYKATQLQRDAAVGGPHGPAAVGLLARYISPRKASPGFSNHSNGTAVDFTTTVAGTLLTDKSAREAWRESWLHAWLVANASPENNGSRSAWKHYGNGRSVQLSRGAGRPFAGGGNPGEFLVVGADHGRASDTSLARRRAKAIGRGGLAAVTAATGVLRKRIGIGIRELERMALHCSHRRSRPICSASRVARRAGNSRRSRVALALGGVRNNRIGSESESSAFEPRIPDSKRMNSSEAEEGKQLLERIVSMLGA